MDHNRNIDNILKTSTGGKETGNRTRSKATAIAPSNIAFTKYWGRKDEKLRLPENGSISMCLSNLLTTTTVEFSPKYKKDEVIINGIKNGAEAKRIIEHLDRILRVEDPEQRRKAKVVSQNNFPSSTGLSSSASGFAALTLAAAAATGLKLTQKQLSILARQGSGSACRSIPSGFVEWLDGNSNETSYAKQIFPPSFWKIADVVAIVSSHEKDVPTSVGQQKATSSPFMKTRLANIPKKNLLVKKLIIDRNFSKFGEIIEAEALELHSIMMTQNPSLIYLEPNSILLMKLCHKWRSEGLQVYFTVNTGQDVHLIVEQKNIGRLKTRLKNIKEVKQVIVNYPSEGTKLSNNHLF